MPRNRAAPRSLSRLRAWRRVATTVAAATLTATAAVLAAAATTEADEAPTPGLALGSSTAYGEPAMGEQGACPEVAVLAARGSEQNGPDYVTPTRYGANPDLVSSGYEGPAARGLLLAAEERHFERTGESLLEEVPVMALSPEIYPAELSLPAIADTDEEIGALEVALRTLQILHVTPPHEILAEATIGAVDGMRSAIEHTPELLADGEERAGCAPDYVLVGFSQGAVVLTALERELAEEGRLRGVVYMGNPLLKPGDPTTVSVDPVAGGVLRSLDLPALSPVASVPRVNYCVEGDAVCDTTEENVELALRTGLERHTRYFHDNEADTESGADITAQVADSTAEMLNGPVY